MCWSPTKPASQRQQVWLDGHSDAELGIRPHQEGRAESGIGDGEELDAELMTSVTPPDEDPFVPNNYDRVTLRSPAVDTLLRHVIPPVRWKSQNLLAARDGVLQYLVDRGELSRVGKIRESPRDLAGRLAGNMVVTWRKCSESRSRGSSG